MNVSILQDKRQFEFITSQQYKTTMTLTVKRDNKKECVFFVPMEDVLAEISVHDSAGKQLAQLSPKELEDRFGITPDEVSSKHGVAHEESFVRIPVLLLPSGSEIEVLTIRFASPIDPKKYSDSGVFRKNITFGLRISPNEFDIGSSRHSVEKRPCDIHVTIKTGKDYKIHDDYEVDAGPNKVTVTKPSRKIPNLVTFHVSDMDFDGNITGRFPIGIVDSSANTASIILIAGILIPLFLVASQRVAGVWFTPTPEIIGGVIAVVIGSRVWVIQDKYLMSRLIWVYRCTLIVNAVAFVTWFLCWIWFGQANTQA